MILTTIETIPGRQIIEHLGIVQGSSVRAKHMGKDIMAGFRNMVGGEMKGYTELLSETRQEATNRMIQEAQKLGADAILNVRYGTSAITAGAAEVLAYGTAVKLG